MMGFVRFAEGGENRVAFLVFYLYSINHERD